MYDAADEEIEETAVSGVYRADLPDILVSICLSVQPSKTLHIVAFWMVGLKSQAEGNYWPSESAKQIMPSTDLSTLSKLYLMMS